MGRSVGQQELQATHGGWRGGCKRLASEQPLAVSLSGLRLLAALCLLGVIAAQSELLSLPDLLLPGLLSFRGVTGCVWPSRGHLAAISAPMEALGSGKTRSF